jgi:hypothetical protein
MKVRRLISIRRRVPTAEHERYDALWEVLRSEVVAHGAHAWRFASINDPDERLEFVEFAPDTDPRRAPAVPDALRALADAFAEAVTEEWEGG